MEHQIRKNFHSNCKPEVFINVRQLIFLDEAKDDETIAFTITVWHIWAVRNAVKHGENMMHPHSIAKQTKANVEIVVAFYKTTYTSHVRV